MPSIGSSGMPLKKSALRALEHTRFEIWIFRKQGVCLLYTSDAADDLLCVELGGRRVIKKKKKEKKRKKEKRKI